MSISNSIYAQATGAWGDIECIAVNGKKLRYLEWRGSSASISLLNCTVLVENSSAVQYNIPCLDQELLRPIFKKALKIMNACSMLSMLQKDQEYIIADPERPGRICQSDSDDDQVPSVPVTSAFSLAERAVVQHCYNELQETYQIGQAVGFVNCCGKNFSHHCVNL